MLVSTFKKIKAIHNLCLDTSRAKLYAKFVFRIENDRLFVVATDGIVFANIELHDIELKEMLKASYDLDFSFELTQKALSKDFQGYIRYEKPDLSIERFRITDIIQSSGLEFVHYQQVMPVKFKPIEQIAFNNDVMLKVHNIARNAFEYQKHLTLKYQFTNENHVMKISNTNPASDDFILVMPTKI